MCPPRHFAVSYSINPWMDPQAWTAGGASLHDKAQVQWTGLRRVLETAGAAIETIEPAPGLPDLVFTANAAVVLDRKATLARFRHGERQGEEPVFAAAFAALKTRGFIDEIVALPGDIMLEGAGDCIFDARRSVFWMGCGFRSDAAAAKWPEATIWQKLPYPAACRSEFLPPRYCVLRVALRQRHLLSGCLRAECTRTHPRPRGAVGARRAQSRRCGALCRQRRLRRAHHHCFELKLDVSGMTWSSGVMPSPKPRLTFFSAAAVRRAA